METVTVFNSFRTKMVRHYKRKVETRAAYGDDAKQEALERVTQHVIPLIRVSKDMGIPARTLRRHRNKKVKNPGLVQTGCKSILNNDVEHQICEHVQAMGRSMFGLTPTQVRRLAYDVVEALEIKNPFSNAMKLAEKDWLAGFLKRHPTLCIRQP